MSWILLPSEARGEGSSYKAVLSTQGKEDAQVGTYKVFVIFLAVGVFEGGAEMGMKDCCF